MLRNLIYLFMFSCIVSCKTTKLSNIEAEVFRSEPHILFVGFKFENDRVLLTSKLITKGQLKPSGPLQEHSGTNDILLVQLDSNSQVLSQSLIANPRLRTVEYVKDDGSFGKKDMEVPNAEFNFRIQLESTTIRIELRVLTSEKFKTLIDVKLEDG